MIGRMVIPFCFIGTSRKALVPGRWQSMVEMSYEAIAGMIRDVWIDKSEIIIRYYEVEIAGGKRVLLPANFSRVDRNRGEVRVQSILASQFADVPGIKNPDQITLLEEDKVCAYYGGGTLYATPGRAEPRL